ncbi:MAG: beta-galactosidase [Verrucomicrobia bacterium]|nr:beta-galactosidase [Verrucomicrobiota bacterium]
MSYRMDGSADSALDVRSRHAPDSPTMNSIYPAILPHILLAMACITRVFAADQTLFDFDDASDFASLVKTDATVTAVKGGTGLAMRMTTGTQQPWPGVTLSAPDGHWDLSSFGEVAVQVKNVGSKRSTLNCRVDNPGADGTHHCVNGSLTLNPGQRDTLRVTLRRTSDDKLGGKLFGLRGYPVSAGGPGTVKPANLTRILLFVNQPKEGCTFEVDEVRATGTHTPPTAWVSDADPFFPFIDTFGQYKHRDWPGKTHSLAELRQQRETEARELAAQPGPQDWDRYGGWAEGPQLHTTGFFRTEKFQDQWWLVDPDGHLFFSHGIDCVRMMDNTPIAERAGWFEDFPGAQPGFNEFLGSSYALKGHYAGRSPQCFAFAAANLQRKYGPDWQPTYATTIHQRLRSWGLNTIANWSDPGVFLMRRTPYTDNLGSHGARMLEGSEGYWGKFPDVFDVGFSDNLRRAMQAKRGGSANDPWCIGYFSDNELSWGDDTSLALGTLRSPPDQPAKLAFVADLKAKYGDIASLNTAWGTRHNSWQALLANRTAPDPRLPHADLTDFYTHSADTYFRTVRDAIKAVAPNQLYLGCRFAWVNDLADRAAGKYCDVISYNLYQRNVADFRNPSSDKPLLIGEFHFGALDRGLFHPGLVPVANQAARARAYTDYVLGTLRHPQFVGTHWFQWMDEPTTGRALDEENYQIGFLDVADTPYRETIAASREVGAGLYRRR